MIQCGETTGSEIVLKHSLFIEENLINVLLGPHALVNTVSSGNSMDSTVVMSLSCKFRVPGLKLWFCHYWCVQVTHPWPFRVHQFPHLLIYTVPSKRGMGRVKWNFMYSQWAAHRKNSIMLALFLCFSFEPKLFWHNWQHGSKKLWEVWII